MEKITGKEIKIIDASIEEIEKKCEELRLGNYYCMMMKLMNDDYLKGIYDVHSNDLEDLIEHSQTSLEDAIKEVIEAFK